MSPPRSAEHLTVADGQAVLQLAAASDIGTVRRENQDAFALAQLGAGNGALLVLADGMGGHADGGVAATLAVTAVTDQLGDVADLESPVVGAIGAANQAIADFRRSRGGEMCGTTLVVALVGGGRAVVANIGDSRGYRLHEGQLAQLTEDHSVMAEQIRAGRLPRGSVAGQPGRNMLTRALMGEEVAADVIHAPMLPGDVLMLCSDGVWDVLSDDRLASLLAGKGDLAAAVTEVCATAIAAGSTDNVTVVACRAENLPG